MDRRRLTLASLLTLVALTAALLVVAAARPDAAADQQAFEATGSPSAPLHRLPISFEPNQGQAAADVAFLARGAGYRLELSATGLALTLGRATPTGLRMELDGADPGVQVRGQDPLPGHINHIIGNDPAKWHTGLPTFASVVYEAVYPGIDLVVKGNHGSLEYDFVVAPGADPARIALAFPEADDVALDPSGDLALSVVEQTVLHRRPFIYQQIAGEQVAVAGGFVVDTTGRVGFDVAGYDTSLPLVIDPVIEYSTTLGGPGTEAGLGLAVDGAGNTYVGGYTTAGGFGTGTVAGAADAFVAKLDPDGALLATTFFGGAGLDFVERIVVDDAANAYAVGSTDSANFPAWPNEPSSAAENAPGGGTDAFVIKFDGSLALMFARYVGGAADDHGYDIAVDDAGRAYITGATDSNSGITTGTGYQSTYGEGGDAFVARVTADGTAVDYATYLGGANHESGHGIAVSSGADPDIYVLGEVVSTVNAGFSVTAGAYQTTYGGYIDVFVAKLNPTATGSHLLYSTYVGGTHEERAGDIALGPDNSVYVAGYIEENTRDIPHVEFPVTNGAYDTTFGGGGWDAFVAKLALDGNGAADLHYATYLGGSGEDWAYGLAVNGSGEAHVTGFTRSADFPLVNNNEGHDAATFDTFVVKVRPDGSDVAYSIRKGGPDTDGGYDVALGADGTAFVSGQTGTDVFVDRIAIAPRNAIYVWRAPGLNGTPIDDTEANRLADFAVAEGIDTIVYDNWGCGILPADPNHPDNFTALCPNGFPQGSEHQDAVTVGPIIEVFHDHGLRVEALYTDNGTRDIDGVQVSRVEEVVLYNAGVSAGRRFDAIRLNIESFACGAEVLNNNQQLVHVYNQPGPPCEINGTNVDDLDVFRDAVEQAGTLPVYVSVGHSWILNEDILDIVAGVDVQTVQDNQAGYTTPDGRAIERVSSDEVCYGNELGKPVQVTIETYDVVHKLADPLSHFNTFYEEGESEMEATLAEINYEASVPMGQNDTYTPPCPRPSPHGFAYHFYRESYGSPILPGWAPDADGDGVADSIDLATDDPLPHGFADAPVGGTRGAITVPGNQVLMVADALDSDDGVVITSLYDEPQDGTTRDQAATIAMYPGEGEDCTATPTQSDPTLLTIRVDTQVVVTCGSIRVDVVTGTVEAAFAASDGTVATTSLGGGNSVTFEPETATFTAPPENSDPVVVTVDGEEISVEPGQTVNVPPAITSITGPLAPLQVGTVVEMGAAFVDPGTGDTHTATWEWGDGTTSPGVVDSAAGTVAGDHTYATPGVYTVGLTVTDDQGGSDTEVFEFVVAYDPDAGFVTGGGWFDSPLGALVADPTATGKANFGYVAKYKKGQTVPDGQTQFQFKAGDLELHSTDYEWLVVTGNDTARFKGTGTINGEGEYKFQIWSYDDPDAIRIRIWSEDEAGNETDVYDTGAAIALGGGNIQVHTDD